MTVDERLRQRIQKRIRAKKEIWIDYLALQYALILLDRIGHRDAPLRGGVPGIWGDSYISTYYAWVRDEPKERSKMEGGIATSYYVIDSLVAFWTALGIEPPRHIVVDVAEFFRVRKTTEGAVGVQTTHRGVDRIDANLRHSAFGYLILKSLGYDRDGFLESIASYLFKNRSPRELWTAFAEESWPVGGIAAYIRATGDALKIHNYGTEDEHKRMRRSLMELVEALAVLDGRLFNHMNTPESKDGKAPTKRDVIDDHYPYWIPIRGLSVLRLHSTVGCLRLVGKEIAEIGEGRKRIRAIRLTVNELIGPSGPVFSSDRSPSLAAAAALLDLLIGDWGAIEMENWETVQALLGYIEQQWNTPEAYNDYWSEFTAPLLSLVDLQIALGQELQLVFDRGTRAFDVLVGGENETNNLAKILRSVGPTALGRNLELFCR